MNVHWVMTAPHARESQHAAPTPPSSMRLVAAVPQACHSTLLFAGTQAKANDSAVCMRDTLHRCKVALRNGEEGAPPPQLLLSVSMRRWRARQSTDRSRVCPVHTPSCVLRAPALLMPRPTSVLAARRAPGCAQARVSSVALPWGRTHPAPAALTRPTTRSCAARPAACHAAPAGRTHHQQCRVSCCWRRWRLCGTKHVHPTTRHPQPQAMPRHTRTMWPALRMMRCVRRLWLLT
jgi:hypothetical protein